MSIDDDDRAIMVFAEHQARVLAGACRSLSITVTEQHYRNGDDAAAALDHCAELLDLVANGPAWDGLRCDEVKSIDELRGIICGVGLAAGQKHEGPGAVRTFPVRSGGTRKLWACDACWNVIQGAPA